MKKLDTVTIVTKETFEVDEIIRVLYLATSDNNGREDTLHFVKFYKEGFSFFGIVLNGELIDHAKQKDLIRIKKEFEKCVNQIVMRHTFLESY